MLMLLIIPDAAWYDRRHSHYERIVHERIVHVPTMHTSVHCIVCDPVHAQVCTRSDWQGGVLGCRRWRTSRRTLRTATTTASSSTELSRASCCKPATLWVRFGFEACACTRLLECMLKAPCLEPLLSSQTMSQAKALLGSRVGHVCQASLAQTWQVH